MHAGLAACYKHDPLLLQQSKQLARDYAAMMITNCSSSRL